MAKVIIPDKICPHCGGNEWYSWIIKSKKKDCVVKYACVRLKKETKQLYIIKNKDKVRETSKIYRINNKNKISTHVKYLIESGYYRSEKQRNYRKKCADALTDTYVRRLIHASTNKSFKDISPSDVIKKRDEIIKIRKWRKRSLSIKNKIRSRRKNRHTVKTLPPSYIKYSALSSLSKEERREINLSVETVEYYRNRLINRRKQRLYKNDNYIKHVIIIGDKYHGIPTQREKIDQEHIEIQREVLKSKRIFKKKKQLLTINSNHHENQE